MDDQYLMLAIIFLGVIAASLVISYFIIIQHNTYMKNHPEEYPIEKEDKNDR